MNILPDILARHAEEKHQFITFHKKKPRNANNSSHAMTVRKITHQAILVKY